MMAAGLAHAQEVSPSDGESRLKDYVTYANTALGDYLCNQTISISTDAKAPVLLAAQADIVFAMSGKYGLEKMASKHEVLDGAFEREVVQFKGREMRFVERPPSLCWGGMTLFCTPFAYYPTDGARVNSEKLRPGGREEMIWGGTVRSPFMQWPVMHYSYLRDGKTFGQGTPVGFLSDIMKCNSAKMQDGKLVAEFITKPDERGVRMAATLTFDDLLIERCFMRFGTPEKGTLEADIATRWDKSLPDPLPLHVHAKLRTEEASYGVMDYVVDFKWSFPGSAEFKEVETMIVALRDKIGPEREVAGTEEPKPDPTKK
jgi:hypothetical protein